MIRQDQIKLNNTEKENKDIDANSDEWKDQLKEMQAKDPTILDSSTPGNIQRNRFSRFGNIKQPK